MSILSNKRKHVTPAALEWTQIDLTSGTIALQRMKKQELRSLRRLRRENPNSRHVFLSNRGTPMTRQNVHAFLSDLGKEAGFEFPVHAHMLLPKIMLD
jgi:site-specific recombinase XerD